MASIPPRIIIPRTLYPWGTPKFPDYVVLRERAAARSGAALWPAKVIGAPLMLCYKGRRASREVEALPSERSLTGAAPVANVQRPARLSPPPVKPRTIG